MSIFLESADMFRSLGMVLIVTGSATLALRFVLGKKFRRSLGIVSLTIVGGGIGSFIVSALMVLLHKFLMSAVPP